MTANAERLYDVLVFLTAHPESHDQGYWLRRADVGCATVGCLAGWTCLRNGYEEVWDSEYPMFLLGVRLEGAPGESWRDVQWAATELLGLDAKQGVRLFDDRNTLADLWWIADELTGGAVGRMRAAARQVSS